MKQILFFILFFLSLTILNAQKSLPKVVDEFAAIDKKALQMPDTATKTTESIANFINSNFSTNTEKVRAIFIWIATNIQYDVDNMYALNFYEQKEEKIAKALKNRKGICENYAVLFDDVCLKLGIKSFVIEGYTKPYTSVDYIPHAWCAALINNTWFMFDPTWGLGYVNNNKFYKKINNVYFKVNPALLIKSHMPFDFLWQFVNYPITNQEFYEGKTQQNKSKPFFNYQDSIQLYQHQNNIGQLKSSAERIERNGIKNAMIFDRLHHIKVEIENHKITAENDRQSQIIAIYNDATFDYNDGIKKFNDFIQYRNKQFIPIKSDLEIQSTIDSADGKLKTATLKLSTIKNPDNITSALITQLNKSIENAATHVKEQQEWLKIYFGKGKSGRKSMFFERKITLFGIPIN